MPIVIPPDSNLRYLPLVYFLPQDAIARRPLLRSLPRDLSALSASSDMIDLIGTDAFLKEIMGATAALVFPHFGFGGWIEHYSGNSPVWRLSYALPVWARTLEAETGWGVQALFRIPPHTEIPFFGSDYIKETCGHMVKRAIAEEGWQPVLDVARKMPCDEDFEKWDTNVRKDFLRKWYHTRSKRVQTVSLEACLEDGEHVVYDVEDVSSRFDESVVSEIFYEQFKARLSQKDMAILELRVAGFTYEEIADKLGYSNHSGVIKRIQSIAKDFSKYEEQH